MLSCIFFINKAEPIASHFRHVLQVAVNALNLGLHLGDEFIGLILVKLQDARHLDFKQTENVVLRHLTNQLGIERREALINMLASGVNRLSIFKGLIFINALFNEDAFERCKMKTF